MHPQDYYEILQVSTKADQEVIKAAYKRLALKYHPDSGGNLASEAKMKLLNEAYEVLSDARKRSAYDTAQQAKNEEQEKLNFAAQLIDRKQYFQAKAILETLNHPTARKWLIQINELILQQSQSKPHQPAPSTPETFESQVEREIRNVYQRTRLKIDYETKKNLERNRQIEKEEEQARILISVYQRLGGKAFEWSGPIDYHGHVGVRKIVTWESIQAQRYEEAVYNIAHLIEHKHSDKDVNNWNIIIQYILDNDTFPQKIKRLGLEGVLDYPVEFAGCTSSCAGCILTLIASFLFFVGSFNLAKGGVIFLILAGFTFWFSSKFKPNWMKLSSRQNR